MKKTFLCIIFICCLLCGFADTGYSGYEWNTPITRYNENDENLCVWEKTPDITILSFSNVIMGNPSIKSFYLERQRLKAITYCIATEDLEELINNLSEKKKIVEIKTFLFSKNDVFNEMKECISNENIPSQIDRTKEKTNLFFLITEELKTVEFAQKCEIEGYKTLKKENANKDGVGTVYIFDYNDDTRIYILSENIEGLTFVAYVPHHKDY